MSQMNRRITGSLFVSLDGVIQAPGGPSEDPSGGFAEGGWVFKLWDEGVNRTLGELFGGEYDLLLGRRTYDISAAYWPYVEGPEAGMGEAFTKANKYVLTHGGADLGWDNSHALSGFDDIAALKQTEGPDLIVQGSSTLYPELIAKGLIDRLTLLTYPVVLGSGKRWFGADTKVGTLKLTDHYVTDQGTVVTTYEPGGALPPYPAEAPAPSTSAREMARRARIEAGTW